MLFCLHIMSVLSVCDNLLVFASATLFSGLLKEKIFKINVVLFGGGNNFDIVMYISVHIH